MSMTSYRFTGKTLSSMAHGLTHLLTFNAQNFRQYLGLTAVTLSDVLTP
jgi:hypothetical protein